MEFSFQNEESNIWSSASRILKSCGMQMLYVDRFRQYPERKVDVFRWGGFLFQFSSS